MPEGEVSLILRTLVEHAKRGDDEILAVSVSWSLRGAELTLQSCRFSHTFLRTSAAYFLSLSASSTRIRLFVR